MDASGIAILQAEYDQFDPLIRDNIAMGLRSETLSHCKTLVANAQDMIPMFCTQDGLNRFFAIRDSLLGLSDNHFWAPDKEIPWELVVGLCYATQSLITVVGPELDEGYEVTTNFMPRILNPNHIVLRWDGANYSPFLSGTAPNLRIHAPMASVCVKNGVRFRDCRALCRDRRAYWTLNFFTRIALVLVYGLHLASHALLGGEYFVAGAAYDEHALLLEAPDARHGAVLVVEWDPLREGLHVPLFFGKIIAYANTMPIQMTFQGSFNSKTIAMPRDFAPNVHPKRIIRSGFGRTYFRDIYVPKLKKTVRNAWKFLPKSWRQGLTKDDLARPFNKYDKSFNRFKVKVGASYEYWLKKVDKPQIRYSWMVSVVLSLETW